MLTSCRSLSLGQDSGSSAYDSTQTVSEITETFILFMQNYQRLLVTFHGPEQIVFMVTV